MAEARCPASCGELLQGWILGSEKLVSCPINWFSTVEVCDGKPEAHERPRMRTIVQRVLAHYGLSPDLHLGLRIRYESTIPVAKGMASSTADIAAAAVATARHLQQPLSETELAQLCVSIEPTDSTIFRDLTLFDHNSGQIIARHAWQADIDLLVLESPLKLDTADYHRLDRQQHLADSAPHLAEAWRHFQHAMTFNDPIALGRATTLSAEASQPILPKPAFDELRELVEHYGLYGLNVAHSGTVVGLLCNRRQHDIEQVATQIRRSPLAHFYPDLHHVRMLPGGVR